MTLLVGILCKDGVVMASDSAATFAAGTTWTIGQQEVQKVRRLTEQMLYSATGAVGTSQLIAERLTSLAKDLGNAKGPVDAMDKMGQAILESVRPYLQGANLVRALTGESGALCKCLVAVPVANRAQLYQFDHSGAPERATSDVPFVALGSGQQIADPFLALLRRLLWTGEEPTLAEGKLVATWAIDHVRRTNPGGVGGRIQLATLAHDGKKIAATILPPSEVAEHEQRVGSAEQALVAELRGSTAPAPTLPPEPTK